jgi:hypothetical protein
MSVFDLDQKGQQALADDARLNPLDASQITPTNFTGIGKGIGMGVMRGGARVGQFVGMAGAVVPMAIDKITEGDNFSGKSLTDRYFEALDETVNRAVDYWTPNHAEVGKAGQVLGGLSEIILPLMAGGGNPTMLIGSQQMGTATDLVRHGVDADTAAKVGLLQGGATAIGFRLPAAFGSNLWQRLATGSGVNLAVGIPQRGAASMLLNDAGRPDLADAYGNTAESLALDVLTGLAFGGIAHATAPKLKPSEVDAVLTASNAKHFQQDTAPGIPADAKASSAHQSALEQAIEQLVRGERVSVPDSILTAEFVRPVPPFAETPIAAAVRGAFGPDLPAYRPAAPVNAPRGVRNNNPGNIVRSAWVWDGEVAGNDPRFATFDTPEAGIRALAKNLIAYNDKHGLNTVEGIINRWAPPGENKTSSYVQAVAKELGVKPGDVLNVRDPETLIRLTSAIIRHENGKQPYPAETLRAGVELAISGGSSKKSPADFLAAMPRAKALSELDRQIETRFADKIAKDYPAAVAEYNALRYSLGGKVLNVDIARELSPDYATSKESRALLSPAVHEPASFFIKQLYADRLAEMPPGSTVMFTSGGTGAGKSSAIEQVPVAAQAMNDAHLVYDTNMNGLKSAQQKIEQALAAGAKVDIWHVQRDPVDALVNGALPRAKRIGRTAPLEAHEATHVGAAETIVKLAEIYKDDPRVTIHVLDNTRGKGNAAETGIEFVKGFDYNNLRERLISALQKEYQDGRINDAIYRGTLGAVDAGRQDGGTGGGRLHEAGISPGLPIRQRSRDSDAAGSREEGGLPAGRSAAREGNSRPVLNSDRFPVQGKTTTAVTERGTTIQTKFVAVEASSLVTSHDNGLRQNPNFPAELQPRDRSRAASEAQIAKIENGINPELLAESPKASDGAPIIGQDKVVESGNARTIALRRAYEGGKADPYRQWLIDNAERFGLDPAQVAAMKQPVLARVGLGKYDRAEFARQANESAVAQMSVTEQARADAARMPDLMGLVTNEDGSINQTQSAPFIRAFLAQVVSPSEHGTMITSDGALSQQGLQRIRNAVFAKAYGDPEIVAMMAESTDANVKNILAGMLRAAPAVARLKELIDAGARYPMDITGDLARAVRQFSQLRRDGMTVQQMLAQAGLFDGGPSPELRNLLIGLEENAKAPKRVAELIGRVVDAVDRLGDPRQGAMFGDMATPTTHEIVTRVIESVRDDFEVKASGDLFKTPEVEAARQVMESNPDMRVVLDDGTEVSVREAMTRMGDDARQADNDVKAFVAAVTCYMRNL